MEKVVGLGHFISGQCGYIFFIVSTVASKL
jgi:hypothetical protein